MKVEGIGLLLDNFKLMWFDICWWW